MRFQVPQFIEVESKIFGPLTLKQFIYLLGGAGVIFLLYVLLNSFIFAIILGLPIGAFSLALAFYKVNNQPFIKLVESALKFSMSNKLYLWKKENKKISAKQEKQNIGKSQPQIFVPKITQSKLKDLSWSLDIKEKIK